MRNPVRLLSYISYKSLITAGCIERHKSLPLYVSEGRGSGSEVLFVGGDLSGLINEGRLPISNL